MPDAYQIVRQAIIDKNSISATYDGYPRELTPHVIGTKRGVRHALFYQFGGQSSSGLGPVGSPSNWRCIDVDKLTDVRVIVGVFHTAPNHTRPQTCVDVIDAVVRY